MNVSLLMFVGQVACTQVHALYLRMQGSSGWDTSDLVKASLQCVLRVFWFWGAFVVHSVLESNVVDYWGKCWGAGEIRSCVSEMSYKHVAV